MQYKDIRLLMDGQVRRTYGVMQYKDIRLLMDRQSDGCMELCNTKTLGY